MMSAPVMSAALLTSPLLRARGLALALAACAAACSPVEENEPTVVSLGTTRPRKPQAGNSTQGSSFDPQRACNNGPMPALALESSDDCKDISFENDVLKPLFEGPHSCTQAGVCHGANTGSFGGHDLLGDANTLWHRMRTTGLANKPYINICSTDPNDSALSCNLRRGDGQCGSPMPPTTMPQVPESLREKIDAWLRCGAPNN